MKIFEKVRNWGEIRGIGKVDFQSAYQKVLQEVVEIHDAYNQKNKNEIEDAIGDTMVTLINLANTQGMKAEECLEKAFDVIELRKGLVKHNIFCRYAKLNKTDQHICDQKQGNPGNQYFHPEAKLTPENFKE